MWASGEFLFEPALTCASEVFGASEDESPEMDHSEDTENGMDSASLD